MKLYGALEAGGTKMVCAVGDENGRILERVSIPTGTPADTMPPMLDFFRDKGISALGIGCFGPVDLNRDSRTYGFITSTPKLAWQNYDIVGAFRQGLGVPVGFDTDVNAAALGEATWGCTRDVANSIYVTVGTGIGAGVIVNGKPLHGMMHPEGGHILISRHPDDPLSEGCCPFHKNCLEGLAAGPSLEKRWGVRGAELSDRKEVWDLEAYYIAQAICNYIMVVSPEMVILGGGVMHQEQLFPLIREKVLEMVAGYIQTEELADIDYFIVPASLHDDQGIMGCLELARRELQN